MSSLVCFAPLYDSNTWSRRSAQGVSARISVDLGTSLHRSSALDDRDALVARLVAGLAAQTESSDAVVETNEHAISSDNHDGGFIIKKGRKRKSNVCGRARL